MPETLESPASAPPPGGPPVATDDLEPKAGAPLWAAAVSLVAIFAVIALAFSGAAKPGLADQVTLPALALFAALFGYLPLLRRLREDRDAASFALCAALFVVYGLARRFVPANTPALHFFGDDFPIPCAAFAVLLGALLGAPAWLKNFNGWTRTVLVALALLALLGFASFRFLASFYPVGTTATLDPTNLVHLGMQVVEFGALALCCAAVAAHATTRRLALIVLPALLLALWARHHFMAAPAEEEDE